MAIKKSFDGVNNRNKSILIDIVYYFLFNLINVQSIISFKALKSVEIHDFEGIPDLIDKMVEIYSKSYMGRNFSFRILLPRSKDSQIINNLAKKLGLQIQHDFLIGISKLKLKPQIREFRYIHDDNRFGWLLIDQSIYESLV